MRSSGPIFVTGAIILSGILTAAAEEDAHAENFRETIDSGLLFMDKQFAPSPYVLEADETRLTINGVEVAGPLFIRMRQTASFDGADEGQATGQEWVEGQRREPGQRRWRRQGGQRTATGPRAVRRAGFGRFGGQWNTPPRKNLAIRFAEDLAIQLSDGATVFLETGKPAEVIFNFEEQKRFLELIVQGGSATQQGEAGSYGWVTQLQSEPLLTMASRRLDYINDVASKNESNTRAVRRLYQWSYPLTVGGMVISVFSLGHLLKSAPKVQTDEQRRETAGQWTRLTIVSIGLFIVMSSLDLTWTLLASGAGQMHELNPIGSKLVDSPDLLIVFKLGATFISAGILFCLRKHSQAQVASWWVCLICTVLTMRWIVFNSMFVS